MKISLYAKHGIPEVWIFDETARAVSILSRSGRNNVSLALDARPDPRAFAQWMKRMTPFLKATAALDHLLWLLAAADYGQGGR